MLWSLYFMQAQGYEVDGVELYQDNISTQMLEVNGKFSSSKKTKHIKAKFFFIKDKVDSGEIRVVDCPTEDMWADVQSKPTQGKLFRRMRAKLMGCAEDYNEGGTVSEERHDKENKARRANPVSKRAAAARRPQECVGSCSKPTPGTGGVVPLGTNSILRSKTSRSGKHARTRTDKHISWAAVVKGG